jgi:hypothetical protein
MSDITPSHETGKSRRRKRLEPPPEQINAEVERHFEMIDKSKLVVPVELYQRDESGGVIAREIATHFDWVAFGALTVIRTDTGINHVTDGGTRLAGANMRPDFTELPCIVFTGLSEEEEAKVFLRINDNRRKLRVDQLQKSELFAGMPVAIAADKAVNWFLEHGVSFDATAVLRSGMKKAPAATKKVVEIVPLFAADKHLTARVFKGLLWLETELNKFDLTLARKPTLKKLRTEFNLLDTYVAGAIPPRTPGDKSVCGRAIARKLRIRVPSGSKA